MNQRNPKTGWHIPNKLKTNVNSRITHFTLGVWVRRKNVYFCTRIHSLFARRIKIILVNICSMRSHQHEIICHWLQFFSLKPICLELYLSMERLVLNLINHKSLDLLVTLFSLLRYPLYVIMKWIKYSSKCSLDTHLCIKFSVIYFGMLCPYCVWLEAAAIKATCVGIICLQLFRLSLRRVQIATCLPNKCQ